jgi:hypothetical protein
MITEKLNAEIQMKYWCWKDGKITYIESVETDCPWWASKCTSIEHISISMRYSLRWTLSKIPNIHNLRSSGITATFLLRYTLARITISNTW